MEELWLIIKMLAVLESDYLIKDPNVVELSEADPCRI